MKKIIIILTSILSLNSYSQNSKIMIPKDCQMKAIEEARKITGNSEITNSLIIKVDSLTLGTIYEIAYFTDSNYKDCASMIKNKNYSCNSAIIDIFQDIISSPNKCNIIASEIGDGNG